MRERGREGGAGGGGGERERGRDNHFRPPFCRRHITDTPASEREFVENLHELDHKINFLNLQVQNINKIKLNLMCTCTCMFTFMGMYMNT